MIFKRYYRRFITLIVLFFLIGINDIIGQENLSDFKTWSAIELKYEQSENLTFSFQGQLRMKDDVSTVDQYFGELGVQYKLPSNFRLGVGFRYIRNNDTNGNIQGYENFFRYNIDLSYRHKLDRLGLKYRIRYQNRNEIGLSSSEGDIARQRFRFKTTFDYNIRNWKLDPELSGELFNGFRKNGTENGFDKYRISLGTSYKVKKIGRFSLFYRLEKEFNVTNPETLNILSFKYTYTIK